jgi:hypothetical protein
MVGLLATTKQDVAKQHAEQPRITYPKAFWVCLLSAVVCCFFSVRSAMMPVQQSIIAKHATDTPVNVAERFPMPDVVTTAMLFFYLLLTKKK